MKRATLSTALYVTLVFLSGAVVGGFAHRLYMVNTVFSVPVSPKPEDVRRKIVEEMRSKWDEEAHIRAKPELKAIQEDQVQKVKEILTEAQRPEYDKYRADREKQRQQDNSKPDSH